MRSTSSLKSLLYCNKQMCCHFLKTTCKKHITFWTQKGHPKYHAHNWALWCVVWICWWKVTTVIKKTVLSSQNCYQQDKAQVQIYFVEALFLYFVNEFIHNILLHSKSVSCKSLCDDICCNKTQSRETSLQWIHDKYLLYNMKWLNPCSVTGKYYRCQCPSQERQGFCQNFLSHL